MRISDWSSDVCSSDLHQHVARMQQPGQIADHAIAERITRCDQHPCGIARTRRAQRYPFGRQFEVKQIDAQRRSIFAWAFAAECCSSPTARRALQSDRKSVV